MNGFWHAGIGFGILAVWVVLCEGFRTVRQTTLVTAWIIGVLATAIWTVTWFSDQVAGKMSPAFADHAWYGCAVLSLCPPISVLGSRRPGTRVWTWFILVPMMLALCWPVAALWWNGSELRRLQLETPQLVAFCLVLVMGVGNYCGTTFTVSALLYGGAIAALAISNSAELPSWLPNRDSIRSFCTVVMIVAVGLSRYSRRPAADSRFDRLWFDFFDAFGIVWGRRIQDRINFIAASEQLPVRVELDGFAWTYDFQTADSVTSTKAEFASDGATSTPDSVKDQDHKNLVNVEARVEHILRWLLRRFTDPGWIDERLGASAQPNRYKHAVDS